MKISKDTLKAYQAKKWDDEVVVNTEDLQLESLVQFASALGYESCWSTQMRLLRFKQPAFRCIGEEYKSVRSMIKLHNQAPEDVWTHIATVNMPFKDFMNTEFGESMVTILFAGQARIIDKVKGQWSRDKGFFVADHPGNHMISFQSDKDYNQYKHFVLTE